jgi:hypothetical protein
MAAYEKLKDAVYKTVSAMFPSNQVIWMYGNGTEPSNPYVALHILSMDQIGREQTSTSSMETATGSDTYIINTLITYEALIQLNFKGSTAGDLVSEFNQNLSTETSLAVMRKNNLGKMRTSSIRNAPQVRDTKYVQTFIQDVTFSYALRTAQDVGYIKQVIIEDQNSGDRYEIPETIG